MKIRGNTVGTNMSVDRIAEKIGTGGGGKSVMVVIDIAEGTASHTAVQIFDAFFAEQDVRARVALSADCLTLKGVDAEYAVFVGNSGKYVVDTNGNVEWADESPAADDSRIGANMWSSKNTVDKLCPSFSESGGTVRCEPVEGYPLSITAEDGATTINRCGKNVIDYTQAAPRNDTQIVNVIENGVEWTAGNHFFAIPCNIRAGDVVVFSCVDEADAINGIILYDSKTKTECSSLTGKGRATTAKADADIVRVYKREPTTQITTPIVITNLQLEIGAAATAYEPYKEIETLVVGETIRGARGVNTLWANTGEITVTGKADPVAIIEKLTQAVLAMGSNI